MLSACSQQIVEAPKEQQETVVTNADGCTVATSSKLVTQHQVSPIFNLVKDKNENGSCKVNFDITVNGKTYHLEEYEEGLEQIESLCYYARERARENLLLDLGGEFRAESKIACTRRET
jgi:hypothetical protein